MWTEVGIRMADAIADVGKLVREEMSSYGLEIPKSTA
jgi:succinyl-CoA synthetase alpha subunit